MKQISALELLLGFGEDDQQQQRELILPSFESFPDATAVVRYVNEDLSDCQNLGQIILVFVGPSNSIKTLDAVPKTSPYRVNYGHSWQYCVQGWCPADEVLEFLNRKGDM